MAKGSSAAALRHGIGRHRRSAVSVACLVLIGLAGPVLLARAHPVTVNGGSGDNGRGNDRVVGGPGRDRCRTDWVKVCP